MKKKMIAALLLETVALTAACISTSYALFAASVQITQGIGSSGLVKKSIYLCPYIWEVDSPLYVMHVWNSSDGSVNDNLQPSKTVSVTVNTIAMDCKVYEFDNTLYDRFVFYRMNPSNADDFRPEASGGGIWNKTDDVTYTSSKNVYRIVNWTDSPNSNSGYNDYLFS